MDWRNTKGRRRITARRATSRPITGSGNTARNEIALNQRETGPAGDRPGSAYCNTVARVGTGAL
eukprot:179783-Prymnesium_polylepis.1